MTHQPSLIVHGGTGNIADDLHEPARQGVRRAAELGRDLLNAGRSALDVVEQVVRLLEDDPTFDAGRGSYMNTAGHVELDALIMDGASLSAGSVASVCGIANPISLARLVMEQTPHVLLVADGAQDFAVRMGIPLVPEESLVTKRELARWQAAQSDPANRTDELGHRMVGGGTVGAVARDKDGNIAAATSTGGTKDKMPGRVGDSPIIGCGGYADNLTGGASATGLGEALMKVVMSKTVCDLIRSGLTAQSACEQAVARLDGERIKGWGGVIAVDHEGRVGFAYNAPHMSRAYLQPDGSICAEV